MNGVLWVIDQLGQELMKAQQTIAQLRAQLDQLQAQDKEKEDADGSA